MQTDVRLATRGLLVHPLQGDRLGPRVEGHDHGGLRIEVEQDTGLGVDDVEAVATAPFRDPSRDEVTGVVVDCSIESTTGTVAQVSDLPIVLMGSRHRRPSYASRLWVS